MSMSEQRMQFAAAVAADRDEVDVLRARDPACSAQALRSTTSTMRGAARTSASTGSSSANRALRLALAVGAAPARKAAVRSSPSSAAGSVSRNGHGGSEMRPAAASISSGWMAGMLRPAVVRCAPSVSTSMARVRDQDRVLPLRRERVILGDHGPAVGQQPHVALAGVDHRLDRERHAGRELDARCRGCRNAAPADPRGRCGRCRGRSIRARPRSRCPRRSVWIAWPMSPSRAPGRTTRMPRHMASYVRSSEALHGQRALPTQNIRLVSPWKPSLMTVTSTLTMSPCLRRRSLGMPWQTTWFTEVQMDFGKPR